MACRCRAAKASTLGAAAGGLTDRGAGRFQSCACSLQGLSGPINGKTYEAQMVTMGTNTDQWLADVACYVRKAFGNQGALVTKDDVKKLRAATKTRTLPWTIEELNKSYPQPLEISPEWKLTASHKPEDCGKAVDGNPMSRWTTGQFQKPGEWFQIELPAETEIVGLVLDTSKSANDYPRGYIAGNFP